MYENTDTKVLECETIAKPPKSALIRFSPVWIAFGVLLIVALLMAAILKNAHRRNTAGVMEAAYVGNTKAREFIKSIAADGPVLTAPAPKFNHVIFRLDAAEIFRFTYRDGGEGLHYSFEVREGCP